VNFVIELHSFFWTRYDLCALAMHCAQQCAPSGWLNGVINTLSSGFYTRNISDIRYLQVGFSTAVMGICGSNMRLSDPGDVVVKPDELKESTAKVVAQQH
jgi:hypothetical protein